VTAHHGVYNPIKRVCLRVACLMRLCLFADSQNRQRDFLINTYGDETTPLTQPIRSRPWYQPTTFAQAQFGRWSCSESSFDKNKSRSTASPCHTHTVSSYLEVSRSHSNSELSEIARQLLGNNIGSFDFETVLAEARVADWWLSRWMSSLLSRFRLARTCSEISCLYSVYS
jgi:hypothetical protein